MNNIFEYTGIPGLNIESFLKFAENPNDTAQIIKVQETIAKSTNRAETSQWVYKSAMQDKGFLELYERKAFAKLPTIEELSKMPSDSLGNSLFHHVTKYNLNLNFDGLHTEAFYLQMSTPLGFLGFRALTQHDVYHVVLGMGVEPIDEFNLSSFQLGQFYSPYHMCILSAGLLNITFLHPEKIPQLLNETVQYYELGKRAKFFPGFPFENYWTTPLSEVRKLVGVSNTSNISPKD